MGIQNSINSIIGTAAAALTIPDVVSKAMKLDDDTVGNNANMRAEQMRQIRKKTKTSAAERYLRIKDFMNQRTEETPHTLILPPKKLTAEELHQIKRATGIMNLQGGKK